MLLDYWSEIWRENPITFLLQTMMIMDEPLRVVFVVFLHFAETIAVESIVWPIERVHHPKRIVLFLEMLQGLIKMNQPDQVWTHVYQGAYVYQCVLLVFSLCLHACVHVFTHLFSSICVFSFHCNNIFTTEPPHALRTQCEYKHAKHTFRCGSDVCLHNHMWLCDPITRCICQPKVCYHWGTSHGICDKAFKYI